MQPAGPAGTAAGIAATQVPTDPAADGGDGTSLQAGARLGPFRLLKPLGSGGMGTVWLAEQDAPQRLVALKTIRPELLGGRLRERFEHEARFLAALDHPGIARVYQAGSTAVPGAELPWLALEYVEGVDLLEHARQLPPGLAPRLRLLIAICQAVQHAHVRGVIHRDLKPANILVERASGQPKILDFGIARAVDERGPVATRLTRVGEVVGTVEYMSPEQLAGDPARVDLRTDVHALGVLAFELLTGELPHELGAVSLLEAIRRVQHEPPRRLATLRPELRGDLDTIVGKALAAEPEQRYQSAAALAEDLQNLLDDRPVRARPPSAAYLLGKFVRRHRALVGAALLALLALLGATVFSLHAARQARLALAEAQARTQELQAVNDFVGDMLAGADPELGGSTELPLKDVLDAAERGLQRHAAQPRTAGQVALLLGRTWGGLGDGARAVRVLEQALEWQRAGYGDDSIELAEARIVLAEERARGGDLERAAAELQALLAGLEAMRPRPARQAIMASAALAQVIQAQGQAAAAIAMLRRAVAEFAALARPGVDADADLLDGMRYNLGYASLMAGDFKEAETLLRATVEAESRRLGPDHPQTLYSVKALGQSLHRQGRLDEALQHYQQVYAERRRIYGPTHPATLNGATQVAAALNTLQRPAEAEPLLREVLAGRAARNESERPDAIAARNILAGVLEQLGRRDEALALAAAGIASEANGGPNPETLAARNIHASLLLKAGRIDEAAAGYEQLLPLLGEVLGAEHVNYALFSSNAAAVDLARQRYAAARERLQAVLPAIEGRFGPQHARTREAYARLAAAETGLGNADAAAGWRAKADG